MFDWNTMLLGSLLQQYVPTETAMETERLREAVEIITASFLQSE